MIFEGSLWLLFRTEKRINKIKRKKHSSVEILIDINKIIALKKERKVKKKKKLRSEVKLTGGV